VKVALVAAITTLNGAIDQSDASIPESRVNAQVKETERKKTTPTDLFITAAAFWFEGE